MTDAGKLSPHRPFFDGTSFDIRRWRAFLKQVANDIVEGQRLEVICPFGFEVLEDFRFFLRPLQRFYCYLRLSPSTGGSRTSIATLEQKFLFTLVERLRATDSQMAEDIVVMAARSGAHIKRRPDNYRCKTTDKLVVVEHRIAPRGLLRDYSDYIVSCLGGFHYRSIPELKRLGERRTARLRITQLYIMLENLLGHLVTDSSNVIGQALKMTSFQDEDLQFYFSEGERWPPSQEEKDILDLIAKRTDQLWNAACTRQDEQDVIVPIECKAYHGEEILRVDISEKLYKAASDKIFSSYMLFE